MAKNAGKLAGLAALGAAAYMMSKGKGKEAETTDSKPTRAARPNSTETREEPRRKIEDYQAKAPLIDEQKYPSGVMGGAKQAEVVKDNKPAQVDRNENYSNEGRYKPEIKTEDKPLYKQENVTIGGVEKRTEGNKPMPSLAAVERKAAARKASISTDEMKNRSRAQAAHIAKMKRLKANPESQAAEPVYPEQFITPGGSVKTIAGMAKNLANRNVVSKAPEYSTPLLAAPAKQLTGPSKADIVTRDRAARAASRQDEMLKENASRYGLNPNAPGYEATARSLRKNIGGEDFSLGMKRGGAVKMTASSRADGIASRGKTKCKMY
jgi:hypothetical protein